MSDLRPRKSPKGGTQPEPQSNGNHGNYRAGQSSVLISRRFRLMIVVLSLIAAWFLSAFYKPGTGRLLSSAYAVCAKTGAKIYTVDSLNSKVQCVLVKDSLIMATGSLDEVHEIWETSKTSDINQTSDLDIRYIKSSSIVVPGLSDSHAHILEYGANRILPLDDAKSIEAVVTLVKDYIISEPDVGANPDKAIEGWGWDHTSWEKEEWPTSAAFDLDPLVRGRKVVLRGKDGHALWVSNKVLEMMGPLPNEVDGGFIIRDGDGRPTGVFIDNAQELVNTSPPTEQDLEKRFGYTVRDALKHGLTSIHDAALTPKSLSFFKNQTEKRILPIRIYGMTFFDETAGYWGDTTEKILDNGETRLTVRSVKIFADGALRTGGAALYEPYADNPETCGVMRTDPDVLNDVIPKYLKDGWQVNVHAIGDRANAIVLDAFEAALAGANVTALRPRLEHGQILTERDMARIGRLGVIASVQPTHVIDDMWYAEDRLGPERIKSLYAFRSIIENGGRITLGSDMPVEGVNPLAGFYAAITRLSADGRSPHGPKGWFPEQTLTRQEALRGMTIDPAYASFTESMLGSLERGKRADFVILSQDIMTVPAKRILETKVLATAIDGQVVYGEV